MIKLFGFAKSCAFSSSRSKSKKVSDFKALPQIRANVSVGDALGKFGNDLQKAMNFLNKVSNVIGVDIPRPTVLESTKNVSHSLYEAIAHSKLPIPSKFKFILKDEFSSVDSITYYGRAKLITEARHRALLHLAECLYSVLKSADMFLPASDQDPKKVLPFVKFDLSDAQRSSLKSTMEELKLELEKCPISEATDGIVNFSPSFASISESSEVRERLEPLHGKLPIYRHYQEIVDSVERHQVTIISATTGSGKTTQIPQFLLHHFKCDNPSIIVTQPRRVAAISLASRVAHEIGENRVGSTVGYNVRFDSVLPNPLKPNILFCTSGLLLKKLQSMRDETVSRCTHLILDEIHERDINTDILLLAVRRLLSTNRRLKVIIMSATLDAEKFHEYFGRNGALKVGSPIKIETTTNFPVAHYHLEDVVGSLKRKGMYPAYLSSPTRKFMDLELEGNEALPEIIPTEIISAMIKNIHENKPDGSILCFLPGWEEITAVKTELEKLFSKSRSGSSYQIYCVHSSAPPEVTQSIFLKTEGCRKVILATNIAESSITIPDVAYVVDSGKQKINLYNPALRMNSLKTTWISKSNSIQRLGRVGRTQPGEYYLMCSRNRRLNLTLPPEILRIGLEEVCLSIKGLGFQGKCRDIVNELLDEPNKVALRDAVKRLVQLDALEPESENITELGKVLSSIPLNPSLGKALVLSHALGCSKDMLTIAAGVGERILRIPRFEDEKELFSDFIRELRRTHEDDHDLLKKFISLFQEHNLFSCFSNENMKFISTNALKRINRIRSSLESQLKQFLPASKVSVPISLRDDICKLLCCGAFYPDIAFKLSKRNNYLLPGGISAELQKESLQYVESLEASLDSAANGGHTQLEQFVPGKALVFEELFDAGHSMIVRSSVVDPLFSAIFSDSIQVLFNTIYVDGWIRIISDNPENLQILVEMREIWKIMTKYLVSGNISAPIRNSILSCVCEFAKIWDSNRNVEIK